MGRLLENLLAIPVALILVLGGGIIGAYFLNKSRGIGGVTLGFTLSVMAAIALTDTYLVFPWLLVRGGLAVASAVVIAALYFVSGRDMRVFVLLGFLIIPLLGFVLLPGLTTISLYAGISVAGALSYTPVGLP